MKMNGMAFCTLLFCATASVGAMDEDEVAVAIFEEGDEGGRIIKFDDLIVTIEVHENFSEKQKQKLKKMLENLSIEKYNTEIATVITRRKSSSEGTEKRNSRKKKHKDPLIAVFHQMVKEMKSSGEVQKKAYEQQVKTATRATYSAIAAGGVGLLSVLFNILQGFEVFE